MVGFADRLSLSGVTGGEMKGKVKLNVGGIDFTLVGITSTLWLQVIFSRFYVMYEKMH